MGHGVKNSQPSDQTSVRTGAPDAISFGPFRLYPSQRLLVREDTAVQIGSRALATLLILVQHAGKVVDKDDLMAQVWPDVNVVEGSVRVQIATLRKALGEGQDGTRYVATVARQGYCFVAPIAHYHAPVTVPLERSRPDPKYLLPARLTRMVGRKETIREIVAQLASERFVTLKGPGGIGKTSVAISIGHELRAVFDGCVCFFDLGALSDARVVPNAIASALSLSIGSNDPILGLVAFLKDRRMLLILDSCEHVIATTAALAERIFREAPQIHILATSRESLRVEGERVHQLDPLNSPPNDTHLTAVEALGFPAVELFVERVTASGRQFELTDTDAPIVGEMCRRLEGIALAIELAASLVSIYSVQEILTLLNSRINMLPGGRRTAHPRHQTLSATLDWSYDLLTNVERLILQRLSAFVGLFTLDAACCVAAVEVADRSEIVTTVASLVGKSLIAADAGGTTARYRLLDSTRAYAADKLASTGELDEIRRRHAIYFRDCLEGVVTEQSKSREGRALLTEQIANARIALDWCFSPRGDPSIGVELATAAAPLLSELSLFAECDRWTEKALHALAGSAQDSRNLRHEMKLQASRGASLLLTRGYQLEARSALTKALALAEQLDDAFFQMRLLRGLHMFLLRVGEFRNAALLAQRNFEIASVTGDPSAIAMAKWVVGLSNYFMGNQLSAEVNCEACLSQPHSRRVNESYFWFDDHTRTRVRCAFAAIRWLRGFPDQAVRIAQETINQDPTQEHPATFSTALILGSVLLLRIGDVRIAGDAIGRLAAHVERHSLIPFRAICVGLQGTLSIHCGGLDAGVELLRQAIKKLESDRYELHIATFLGSLAEGLLSLARPNEALSAVEGAIERAERIGMTLNVPELLRVKGNIFASAPRSDVNQAEACYLASLELADQQSALAWKLRTATSLATLWLRRGEIERARNALKPIYDSYSEGFASRDLVIAQGLLVKLDQEKQPGPGQRAVDPRP